MRVSDLPLVASVSEWHVLLPSLARDHLYEVIRTGELKSLHHGRRVLVTLAAMLDWLGEPNVTPEVEL